MNTSITHLVDEPAAALMAAAPILNVSSLARWRGPATPNRREESA